MTDFSRHSPPRLAVPLQAPLAERSSGGAELADEEIARRVVAGETALFELLMRRHNQRLFRVARGVVDDDLEAEDVLQDAWVRAYEHLAEFRGEARLTTWLSRIALHEAYARARRGRRFVTLGGGSSGGADGGDGRFDAAGARDSSRSGRGVPEPATPRPGPDETAWSGELRAALERAVARMAPIYRSVFLLREIEGLSTAETADALELTVEAVRVRLHRARALLRTDLERQLGQATPGAFTFLAARCDRVTTAVLARIAALR